MVPSAFTLTTGKDHWHALLKTRAIENGAYVLAPAQWGTHDEAGLRKSYGHSVIIDPWGTVIAEASDGEGLCCAEIELDRVERVRSAIPVQANRRLEGGFVDGNFTSILSGCVRHFNARTCEPPQKKCRVNS